MIAYNIGFVCRRDEVLLLNREFPGWMGCWNGIGGKLESGEALRNSMVREIREEAFLESGQYELQFKGLVTWGGGCRQLWRNGRVRCSSAGAARLSDSD